MGAPLEKSLMATKQRCCFEQMLEIVSYKTATVQLQTISYWPINKKLPFISSGWTLDANLENLPRVMADRDRWQYDDDDDDDDDETD